ncbi:MAG: hypothetical protein LPK26_11685 [Bacillaceae bacterium]|nr:hypothetical protein [Bacillaceae bacterium]
MYNKSRSSFFPKHDAYFYMNSGYKKAMDFINGELNEDDYIKSHEDSAQKNTLSWPELYLLKRDMELFRIYLLKFSLTKRRLVLMNEEIIGFSQNDLYNNYGVNFEIMRKFIGKKEIIKRPKSKPKIRNIEASGTFHNQFIATISILARVPFEWLVSEKPNGVWENKHFYYLPNPLMDAEEFISFIQSVSEKIHDVRGIILKLENGDHIYIRVESIFGGLILEIFNKGSSLNYLVTLFETLKSFDITLGYMETVIPHQVNVAIVCKHKSIKPICLPIEFKSLHL